MNHKKELLRSLWVHFHECTVLVHGPLGLSLLSTLGKQRSARCSEWVAHTTRNRCKNLTFRALRHSTVPRAGVSEKFGCWHTAMYDLFLLAPIR